MMNFYRALVRGFGAALRPLDRAMNRLLTADYNPLYRSGTIAALALVMAFFSGMYLIFFYSLSDPYDSMQRLHDNVWLGPWVRSFHRYASALTLVAVLVHALRMFLHGKSWGRRTLAWTSGLFLLVVVLVAGWTGYTLVWDRQAQALAIAFARMIDTIGIFTEPVIYSFGGAATRPLPSFFFLVLFLHVVVPLALLGGLWLHTSRLARPVWLPSRNFSLALLLLIAAFALLRPVALDAEADLLLLPGGYTADLLYNAWIPAALRQPAAALLGGLALLAFFLLLPAWLKPQAGKRGRPSDCDPDICVGCSQCAEDCPYEAIGMVLREGAIPGTKKSLLAVVRADRCVSCGICAGSCPVYTIGPNGRKAPDQLAAVEAFLRELPDSDVERSAMTVIYSCSNQPGVRSRIEAWARDRADVRVYAAGCGGTLHPHAMEALAGAFRRVVIAACPPRNCTTKDGFPTLTARMAGRTKAPLFTDAAAAGRITVIPVGDGEERQLFQFIEGAPRRKSGLRFAARAATGLAMTGLLAAASHVALSPPEAGGGLLRLQWRLTSQRERIRVERTPEEVAKLPAHMRAPIEIRDEPVRYRLRMDLDGARRIDMPVRARGLREDGPMYVAEDLPMPGGTHQVRVAFEPEDPARRSAVRLEYEGTITVRPGAVTLIHLDPISHALAVRQGAAGG